MAEATAIPLPARAGWRPYQIWVLALLFLATMSNFMDRQILAILQEPIKHDLNLSDFWVGLLSGPLFGLFYSVAGIPIARWAERGHRPRILALALTVWSGMTALCGVAQNYAQLALCRVGVGMGEGGCIPTGHSLLSANFSPRQRGRAMAVLTAGTPVAAFCSPLVGGLVAQHWGWRAAFLVLGVPGLVLAALLLLTVREPRLANPEAAPKPRRFLADAKWLFSNRSFVLLFIATTFTGLAIGSTNVFTGSYFIRTFGLSLGQAGLVMAIGIGLAGVAGNFLGGFLADRFAGERGRGYVLVPALSMGAAGILFLITFSRDSWPVAVGFLFAANIAGDMRTGPVYAAVQNLAPAHMKATAAAVAMLAMTGLGTAFGPVIVGLISDAAASGAFPAELGDFSEACPGGKAAKTAATDLAAACGRASASGLRSAMLLVPILYGGAMAFFYASSRSFRISFADA